MKNGFHCLLGPNDFFEQRRSFWRIIYCIIIDEQICSIFLLMRTGDVPQSEPEKINEKNILNWFKSYKKLIKILKFIEVLRSIFFEALC